MIEEPMSTHPSNTDHTDIPEDSRSDHAHRPASSGQGGEMGPLTIEPLVDDSKLEMNTAREVHLDMDEGAGESLSATRPGRQIVAIVKVTEGGYVPEGVKVRARLSPELFTAEMAEEAMDQLQHDTRVVSVAAPKRIQPL